MAEKEINSTEEMFEGAVYFGEFNVDKELVMEASSKCEPKKSDYEVIIPVFNGNKREKQSEKMHKNETKKTGRLER